MCFGVSVSQSHDCFFAILILTTSPKYTVFICLNLNDQDNFQSLTLHKGNFDLRAEDTANRFSIIFQQVDAHQSSVSVTWWIVSLMMMRRKRKVMIRTMLMTAIMVIVMMMVILMVVPNVLESPIYV